MTASLAAVVSMLRDELAEVLACSATSLDAMATFHSQGLDSLRATVFAAAVSRQLGRTLDPAIVWRCPTLQQLADYLASPEPQRAPVEAAAADRVDDGAIAVVGMACRFPQAVDLEGFWRILTEGQSTIGEVPESRWSAAAGKTRWGAFLDQVDRFDAEFFELSAREAQQMDPQQRLMLELAWEGLEDAGILPERLKHSQTGVYCGAIWSDYNVLAQRGPSSAMTAYSATGSHRSMIANRISHHLGFMGPSLTVDSACSSGLVAVHLACEALRRSECAVALAGAVNLNLLEHSAVSVERFGALSGDGRCYTFDARANGYVRGEGAGLAVLKRLADAIASGDPIYCVLLGSAVNNNGASNGLTAPNPVAQEALLAAAYARARVSPGDVQYVEAHGTGTPLGDPIEVGALARVLGADRASDEPLRLGSAKTNFGHTEGAAGILGLIKVALCLHHRQLVPSLNFAIPNPALELDAWRMRVQTECEPWTSRRPLLAGVSSFGLGGTNSHFVVGERARKVVFVCPGQGAHWNGMARDLLESEPVFRSVIERCDHLILRCSGWSLLDVLRADPAHSRLDRIEVSLPAIISIDIALAQLWRSWGLAPAAVVGHSTGEIAAACIAGVLSLEDAITVICAYGDVIARQAGAGAMGLVGIPFDEVRQQLLGDPRLFAAIRDSATSTVVSGEPEALQEYLSRVAARGVFSRRVSIDVSPHCPRVDHLLAALRERLQGITARPGEVPWFSEVTGAELIPETALAEHWLRNFGNKADFGGAVEALIDRGYTVFLEVGPHALCHGSLSRNLAARARSGQVLASMRRGQSGAAVLRRTRLTLRQLGALDDMGDSQPATLLPFVLSGKTEAALAAQADGLRRFLSKRPAIALSDVSFTLATARTHFGVRAAFTASDHRALLAGLDALSAGRLPLAGRLGTAVTGGVVFVFPGQGAQWARMGQALLATSDVFGTQLAACDRALQPHLGWSVRAVLAGEPEAPGLSRVDVVQPTLFAVMVALAAVWRSMGVQPSAVVGHSQGEIAAAYVAGALSLEDAARVVARRSLALRHLVGKGAMAAIELPAGAVRERLAAHGGALEIAAYNSPSSIVISGDPVALGTLVDQLTAEGVFARRIQVDIASHCSSVEVLEGELLATLAGLRPRAPAIPMMSTVDAKYVDGAHLDARWWYRNLREPVRFADAVRTLLDDGYRHFIEVSAHPLPNVALTANFESASTPATVVGTLRRDHDAADSLLQALIGLHVGGAHVDFTATLEGQRVHLPTYAFQRQRYWLPETPVQLPRPGHPTGKHPLLGERRWLAAGRQWLFAATLGPSGPTWIADHGLGEKVLFPAAGMLEMILAAAEEVGKGEAWEVQDLVMISALVISLDSPTQVQLTVTGDDLPRSVQVYSSQHVEDDAAWTLRAQATVVPASSQLRARWGRPPGEARREDTFDFYDRLEAAGFAYRGDFRSLRESWRTSQASGGARWLRVELPASAATEAGSYGLHPALLDSVLQGCHLFMDGAVGVPASVDRYCLFARGLARLWGHVSVIANDERLLRADLYLVDDDGEAVGVLKGLGIRRRDSANAEWMGAPATRSLYSVRWEPALESSAMLSGRWLLIGDDAGFTQELREAGLRIEHAPTLQPDLIRGFDGIVRSWSVAAAGTPPQRAEELTARALAELQCLVKASAVPRQLVWLVRDDDEAALVYSALWGLARSARAEHPQLGLRVVAVCDEATELAGALALQNEPELRWQDGGWRAPRLVRLDARSMSGPAPRKLASGSDEVTDSRGTIPSDRLARGVPTHGTILITGGLGVLGLLTARELVAGGARSLLMLSRRGAATPGAAAAIATLEALGAKLRVEQCDVADAEALAALIQSIDPSMPLRGIVHCAGALDDRVLSALDANRLAQVWRPKALGAWNLHCLSESIPLELFVLFSSFAGVIGTPGQANYAAANTFVDELARRRAAHGQLAISLAWGLFAERSGMTASLGEAELGHLQRTGVDALTAAEGRELLGLALRSGETLLVPVALRVPELRRRLTAAGVVPKFWRHIIDPRVGAPATALGDQLRRLPREAATARLSQVLSELLRTVLVTGGAELSVTRPLHELGLDSLRALELRNQLAAMLATPLSTTLLFDHPTIEDLTTFLLREVIGQQVARADTTELQAPALTAGQDMSEPIAIVSMACRLPGGADTPEDFWRVLARELDVIERVPASRWDADALYDPDPDQPGKSYVREGGFVRDIDSFDAGFFGIAAREARRMDPQHRLLLECAWECLERAAVVPAALKNSSTGVYVGVMSHGYSQHPVDYEELDGYHGIGGSAAVASGRIAYVLGLHGPTMTLDTACSSSLSALHLACQALRLGECDLALAGGVSLNLTPGLFIEFSRQRGAAPDGRSKSFSMDADGAGWAEGCSLLLLKRLSDAHRDGDEIVALLRGSAMNHDGRSQGLAAPNGPSQEQVIRRALTSSGLSAADIDAVEAHGTGTRLGDAIELGALAAMFSARRETKVLVGSAKSNLGHTQAAAGVVGVIKMALALTHETLPRTLHVTQPSDALCWADSGLALLTEARAWPRGARVRRAGVSSFGVSGSNAHVIVEEAPRLQARSQPSPSTARPAPVFLLSGRDALALAAQAARLGEHLDRYPDLALPDLAFALATTRTHFEQRAAVLTEDRELLRAALLALSVGAPHPQLVTGTATEQPGRVVFVFPGQGSQWPQMGRALLATSAVFRAQIDACQQALRPHLDWSVRAVLMGEAGAPELSRVDVVQPTLFAVMVALAAMWRALGVEPDAVLGHSQGEIAAACVAGALSLEDAAQVVACRSAALRRLAGQGAMAAVELPAAELGAWLADFGEALGIAAWNGPRSVVVSGQSEAVDSLLGKLEAAGVFARRIPVDFASHCPVIAPMEAPLLSALGNLRPRRPAIPMMSALDARYVDGPQLDARWWYRNLREPVRFVDAVGALLQDGHRCFIEVSAHPVLAVALSSILDGASQRGAVVGTLRRNHGESVAFCEGLAALHVAGRPVDWSLVLAGRRVPLPTYAFQRTRYPSARAEPRRPAAPAGTPSQLSYQLAWVPAGGSALGPSTFWRLFGDAELARRLVATGLDVKPIAALDDLGEGDAIIRSWVMAATPAEPPQHAEAMVCQALAELQALLGKNRPPRQVVWLTRGALAGSSDAGLSQSALWGLGRSARTEHPELGLRLIDIEGASDLGVALGLTHEPELRWHNGCWQAPRLAHSPEPVEPHGGSRGVGAVPRDGTVLISGGTGTLGLMTARWLVARGARSLLLVSRRGASTPDLAEAIASLQAEGTLVRVEACDVADPTALAALLDSISAEQPLRGIVHCAGALDDAVLRSLDADRVARTWRPKALGAWHLDRLSASSSLAFFIVFSSFAGIVGAPGQASYAAANVFVDRLVEQRRARGLPALSIAWGLFATKSGMTAHLGAADLARLQRQGVTRLSEDQGWAVLDCALPGSASQVAAVALNLEALRQYVDNISPIEASLWRGLVPQRGQTPTATTFLDQLYALPEHERRRTLRSYITHAAARVLGGGTDPIAADRSFIALGMDSLMGLELRNQLQARLQMILPATVVFEHPTAAALAEKIIERLPQHPPQAQSGRRESGALADPCPASPPSASSTATTGVPASSGQKRLWFLQQLRPSSCAYHELLCVRLTGSLNPEAIGAALAFLLKRHESLRTALVIEDQELVQQVQPATTQLLVLRDLQTVPEPEQPQAVTRCSNELARRPFDLARGRVMRAELVSLKPELHVLLMAIHHIAIDGWSLQILLNELGAAYRSFASQGVEPPTSEVQPLAVQYGDYARWEQSETTRVLRDDALAWWRDTLRGAVSLNLPMDRPQPRVKSDAGGRVPVVFGSALSAQLRALAQTHSVTPFMLLLAIWQTLLGRYTAQTDIVVGTAVANRARREYEAIVGFFVNTLALRTDLSGDPPFEQLLLRVKSVALAAFAHELAPFEQVVAVTPALGASARTLQVMLVVNPDKDLALSFGPELSVHATPLGTETSKFDLLLDLAVGGEVIEGYVEYSLDLFDGATIERLSRHLLRLATDIVENPSKRLSALEILAQPERDELLLWSRGQ